MLKETKNCWFCNIYCTTSFEQIHCSLSSTTNSRTKTELTRLDNQKERNNIISTYFFHRMSWSTLRLLSCSSGHLTHSPHKPLADAANKLLVPPGVLLFWFQPLLL